MLNNCLLRVNARTALLENTAQVLDLLSQMEIVQKDITVLLVSRQQHHHNMSVSLVTIALKDRCHLNFVKEAHIRVILARHNV
jgi:hypothetical protein